MIPGDTYRSGISAQRRRRAATIVASTSGATLATDGRLRKEITVNRTDTDVLMGGAGPVGLLLANDCARRGLRWRLVEARATQSVQSKALAIFPRTLEIL